MKKLLVVAILGVAVAASNAVDAKAIWEKDCAKCHAADGSGNTAMGKKTGARDYTSAKVQDEMKDADMIAAIQKGVKDKEGKVKMKAFELSDEEAKALVAHIRKMKK